MQPATDLILSTTPPVSDTGYLHESWSFANFCLEDNRRPFLSFFQYSFDETTFDFCTT
jgi:hypothetical protein